MGKTGGRKKKNAGVGVDFKRVKHRVGKKLPRAQNQTDTSFKSRTISLAEQSVAADKAGQAVTGRNLTLKDLLGQCGHYSERVRRDALQGLAELLAAHPEELRRHATLVVEAAAARVGDGDAAVRDAARGLLAATLLPALGGAALAPYVPLLMAHVCAAMTHLAEPIRADALGFLELLVGARPDLVAAGFLAPVLLHFSDLLSRGTRGRSIRAGSLASLATVAASLQRFLARALPAAAGGGAGSGSSAGGGAGGGGGSNSVLGGEGGEGEGSELHGVLCWRRCAWPPPDQAGSGGGAAAAAAEGSGTGDSTGGGTGVEPADAASAAAATLLRHLLECWSEAGPSQVAEAPDLLAAQCLTAILRCCDLLLGRWGASLAGVPHDGASLAGAPHDGASLAASLIRKVAPHFPVLRPAARVAPALSDQLVALNVAAAQLLARFLPAQAVAVPAGAVPAGPGARPAGAAGAAGREEPWVGRVLDWFAGVMAEGAALPAADGGKLLAEAAAEPEADAAAAAAGSSSAGRRRGGGGGSGSKGGSSKGDRGATTREAGLPGEVYQSALDGSLRVLPLVPPARRRQLLGGAAALWRRSPPRGAARPRVLAFWAALLRDPAAAFHAPTPAGGPLLQPAEAAAWLAGLPRFLFELGCSSPGASHAALALLLAAARAAPAGAPLAAALQGLQPQLAPLFAVLLPAGGGGSGTQQQQRQQQQLAGLRVHVGPLAGLPVATQELAVDLLYHFPAASEQVLRAAAVVCLGDAFPAATAVRLLEVLAARAAAGNADPATFCGLLLSVLSGGSAAGLRQRSWPRHAALAGAACAAALRLGPPAAVAATLLPPLLAAAGEDAVFGGGSGGGWTAYGLLRLAVALAAASAAAQEELVLPFPVMAALPRLMVQLQACCRQQEQQPQQQPEGSMGGSGGEALDSQAATALCLQLLCLQPQRLLPPLLAELPASLAAARQAQQGEGATPQAAASGAAEAMLPTALQLLLAVVREQRLREALLEEQEGVHAALAVCKAACEAAGSATHSARDWQERLRQLEALCGAVLAA